MNCNIVFTETAKADLRQITLDFVELTKEKQRAISFGKELRSQVDILKQFPECGAIPRDRVLKSSGYRFLVYQHYLLFYQYQKAENTAYVLAVFNGKRDYTRFLKKYL